MNSEYGNNIVMTGTYTDAKNEIYNVSAVSNNKFTEIVLAKDGTVVSAYQTVAGDEYAFNSSKAKDMYLVLAKGLRSCSAKNGYGAPCELGAMVRHDFIKYKTEYSIMKYNKQVYGAYITGDSVLINISYNSDGIIPTGIPYIKLTNTRETIKVSNTDDELMSIPVRSVEEIALEKDDLEWFKNKQYYVVQDDADAEKLFQAIEKLNVPVAYDIESTGLKMNCFGKIGSEYMASLEKYNAENPNDKIRADRLCGIIFCVEPNISYYFPCYSKKYEVLYQNRESKVRQAIINNIKARYTIGDKREDTGDMAGYIRNTKSEDIREDVVLMERVRDILEKKNIITHGGSIEYKTGLMYDIDTNIVDDTMIMHQVMYKFRGGGKPELSNLKFLSNKELGIDQWSLKDFFPEVSDEETDSTAGKVKGTYKGKAKRRIDFSYMDLAGTKVYAPTDGDCTLLLAIKYKNDMLNNHSDLLYLYGFEMIVLLAIGYMEFYGHRIDENKIENARIETATEIINIEEEIRQIINYSSAKEIELADRLKTLLDKKRDIDKQIDKLEDTSKEREKLNDELGSTVKELVKVKDELREEIDTSENVINLGSSRQVAELFYDKLGYKMSGDKRSVAKNALKPLLKEKTEDGKDKYPVVHLYSEYKKKDTLMTKFFDALPEFMYPGGFIFSSYGQISTNTGRMSCKQPNAQQYPKIITKIVIPREGHVNIDADYSQIEYRVLTALAQNQTLIELFSNPDSDYHTLMASLMYGVPYEAVTDIMRSSAKSFNFGIPYGMGLGSLAILLSGRNTMETRKDAEEKYELYFANQPETRALFDRIKESARVNGETKTIFNRVRSYSFTDKNGNENNAKKAAALRQAGNAVIQGSAADIFKISVARVFTFIRNNHLLGAIKIINMIHDEQLMEIDVRKVDIRRVIMEVGRAMQFKLDGFPPLYIGAGVGLAWGYAKGGHAEIHPMLLEQLSKEAETIPLIKTKEDEFSNPKYVVDYFDRRNYEFRYSKIYNYITDPNNWGRALHPAIGKLINSEFSVVNASDYTDDAKGLLRANLEAFIKESKADEKGATLDKFMLVEHIHEEEEDAEYEDEEDAVEAISDYDVREFKLIDESEKVYGAGLIDLIGQFGACLVPSMKVCGVDVRNINYKSLAKLCDYFEKNVCEPEEDGAMQIVYLKAGNIMLDTGIYVKNINSDMLEQFYVDSKGDKTVGDIESRRVK